jgi:hypothetical protein
VPLETAINITCTTGGGYTGGFLDNDRLLLADTISQLVPPVPAACAAASSYNYKMKVMQASAAQQAWTTQGQK